MTALLVLLTFVVFAALDYFLHRRKAGQPAATVAEAAPALETSQVSEPVFVGGYQLPDDRLYHPMHTWARLVAPDTAVVGIDDFASKLTGRARSVRLPTRGDWVRPGERAVQIEVEGRSTQFVCPVDGEVVEVNQELRKEPALATWDPYGRGWLFKVQSPNLAASFRNLLKGRLAREWTEESSRELNLRLMALSGSVLQDGGAPAPDFAHHLGAAEWKSLTDHFFLG